MGWKYYLPEAEQTQEVRKQLDEIQNEYATLDVKEIKVIDPCMGSGHILVYAFDVLMQIYEANGYSQRDAAQAFLRTTFTVWTLMIVQRSCLFCSHDEGASV